MDAKEEMGTRDGPKLNSYLKSSRKSRSPGKSIKRFLARLIKPANVKAKRAQQGDGEFQRPLQKDQEEEAALDDYKSKCGSCKHRYKFSFLDLCEEKLKREKEDCEEGEDRNVEDSACEVQVVEGEDCEDDISTGSDQCQVSVSEERSNQACPPTFRYKCKRGPYKTEIDVSPCEPRHTGPTDSCEDEEKRGQDEEDECIDGDEVDEGDEGDEDGGEVDDDDDGDEHDEEEEDKNDECECCHVEDEEDDDDCDEGCEEEDDCEGEEEEEEEEDETEEGDTGDEDIDELAEGCFFFSKKDLKSICEKYRSYDEDLPCDLETESEMKCNNQRDRCYCESYVDPKSAQSWRDTKEQLMKEEIEKAKDERAGKFRSKNGDRDYLAIYGDCECSVEFFGELDDKKEQQEGDCHAITPTQPWCVCPETSGEHITYATSEETCQDVYFGAGERANSKAETCQMELADEKESTTSGTPYSPPWLYNNGEESSEQVFYSSREPPKNKGDGDNQTTKLKEEELPSSDWYEGPEYCGDSQRSKNKHRFLKDKQQTTVPVIEAESTHFCPGEQYDHDKEDTDSWYYQQNGNRNWNNVDELENDGTEERTTADTSVVGESVDDLFMHDSESELGDEEETEENENFFPNDARDDFNYEDEGDSQDDNIYYESHTLETGRMSACSSDSSLYAKDEPAESVVYNNREDKYLKSTADSDDLGLFALPTVQDEIKDESKENVAPAASKVTPNVIPGKKHTRSDGEGDSVLALVNESFNQVMNVVEPRGLHRSEDRLTVSLASFAHDQFQFCKQMLTSFGGDAEVNCDLSKPDQEACTNGGSDETPADNENVLGGSDEEDRKLTKPRTPYLQDLHMPVDGLKVEDSEEVEDEDESQEEENENDDDDDDDDDNGDDDDDDEEEDEEEEKCNDKDLHSKDQRPAGCQRDTDGWFSEDHNSIYHNDFCRGVTECFRSEHNALIANTCSVVTAKTEEQENCVDDEDDDDDEVDDEEEEEEEDSQSQINGHMYQGKSVDITSVKPIDPTVETVSEVEQVSEVEKFETDPKIEIANTLDEEATVLKENTTSLSNNETKVKSKREDPATKFLNWLLPRDMSKKKGHSEKGSDSVPSNQEKDKVHGDGRRRTKENKKETGKSLEEEGLLEEERKESNVEEVSKKVEENVTLDGLVNQPSEELPPASISEGIIEIAPDEDPSQNLTKQSLEKTHPESKTEKISKMAKEDIPLKQEDKQLADEIRQTTTTSKDSESEITRSHSSVGMAPETAEEEGLSEHLMKERLSDIDQEKQVKKKAENVKEDNQSQVQHDQTSREKTPGVQKNSSTRRSGILERTAPEGIPEVIEKDVGTAMMVPKIYKKIETNKQTRPRSPKRATNETNRPSWQLSPKAKRELVEKKYGPISSDSKGFKRQLYNWLRKSSSPSSNYTHRRGQKHSSASPVSERENKYPRKSSSNRWKEGKRDLRPSFPPPTSEKEVDMEVKKQQEASLVAEQLRKRAEPESNKSSTHELKKSIKGGGYVFKSIDNNYITSSTGKDGKRSKGKMNKLQRRKSPSTSRPRLSHRRRSPSPNKANDTSKRKTPSPSEPSLSSESKSLLSSNTDRSLTRKSLLSSKSDLSNTERSSSLIRSNLAKKRRSPSPSKTKNASKQKSSSKTILSAKQKSPSPNKTSISSVLAPAMSDKDDLLQAKRSLSLSKSNLMQGTKSPPPTKTGILQKRKSPTSSKTNEGQRGKGDTSKSSTTVKTESAPATATTNDNSLKVKASRSKGKVTAKKSNREEMKRHLKSPPSPSPSHRRPMRGESLTRFNKPKVPDMAEETEENTEEEHISPKLPRTYMADISSRAKATMALRTHIRPSTAMAGKTQGKQAVKKTLGSHGPNGKATKASSDSKLRDKMFQTPRETKSSISRKESSKGLVTHLSGVAHSQTCNSVWEKTEDFSKKYGDESIHSRADRPFYHLFMSLDESKPDKEAAPVKPRVTESGTVRKTQSRWKVDKNGKLQKIRGDHGFDPSAEGTKIMNSSSEPPPVHKTSAQNVGKVIAADNNQQRRFSWANRRQTIDLNQNKDIPSVSSEPEDKTEDSKTEPEPEPRKPSPMMSFRIRSNADRAEVLLAGSASAQNSQNTNDTSTTPQSTAVQSFYMQPKKKENEEIPILEPSQGSSLLSSIAGLNPFSRFLFKRSETDQKAVSKTASDDKRKRGSGVDSDTQLPKSGGRKSPTRNLTINLEKKDATARHHQLRDRRKTHDGFHSRSQKYKPSEPISSAKGSSVDAESHEAKPTSNEDTSPKREMWQVRADELRQERLRARELKALADQKQNVPEEQSLNQMVEETDKSRASDLHKITSIKPERGVPRARPYNTSRKVLDHRNLQTKTTTGEKEEGKLENGRGKVKTAHGNDSIKSNSNSNTHLDKASRKGQYKYRVPRRSVNTEALMENSNNNNVRTRDVSSHQTIGTKSHAEGPPTHEKKSDDIHQKLEKSLEVGSSMILTLETLIEWHVISICVLFMLFIGMCCPCALQRALPCPVPSFCVSVKNVFLIPLGLASSLPRRDMPSYWGRWWDSNTTPSSQSEESHRRPSPSTPPPTSPSSSSSFLSRVVAWPFKVLAVSLTYGLLGVVNALDAIFQLFMIPINAGRRAGQLEDSSFGVYPGHSQGHQKSLMQQGDNNGGSKTGPGLPIDQTLEQLRKSSSLLLYFSFDKVEKECDMSYLRAIWLRLIGSYPPEC
ncbi:uncharacterized protein LOC101849337 [Aplysia californica]|uniref:Uncharacterized protein LOC101849337 n=1 Tax=Aplysia californica TaxID=6500 RepID=A0ABM0K973_APLCA|nr:uncharacterized protein LOC101849337 [Aplysia californica]